jgi:sec-independent protein translocase protein TatC
MAPALGNWYDPDGEGYRPPWAGLSVLKILEEFRKRVTRAAIAIAVGVLLAFTEIDRIVAFIFKPMRAALPPGTKLIYTAPGEAFSLYVNIALITGVAIASPYILFQVWRLIAPALYANQKKFAIPFVAMSSGGVIAGWLFSHYVVFPYMIEFFGTFASANLQFMPKVETAWDLYVKMLLGMAIVFQMPTVVFSWRRWGWSRRASCGTTSSTRS